MRRWSLCLLTALVIVSVVSAQELPEREGSGSGIFPLTQVLEAALYAGDGCAAWRPDWPLALPPDAFNVRRGEISGIQIEGEGISLNYRFDGFDRIVEFPLMLKGRMAQVSLGYYRLSELREMTLSFEDEESYRFEFLELSDMYPVLVRGSLGDVWYFIYYSWGVNEAAETWYDEEGNFLGAYVYSLTEIGKDLKARMRRDFSDSEVGPVTEFFYDSRGFLTEAAGTGGVYKVQYYREDLPRYWERRPAENLSNEGTGNYSLQWDERGLLIRISSLEAPSIEGSPSIESGDENSSGGPVDYRYEYTLDEKGNWIERREIQMSRRMGLLVPSPGTTLRRVLEYRE